MSQSISMPGRRRGTAVLSLVASLLLGACVANYQEPTLLTGAQFRAIAAGNTVFSDMAVAPGPPVHVYLQEDGTLVPTQVRQGELRQNGAWLVNQAGLFCIRWPGRQDQTCGYVTDYHNGEYWWRGNIFKVLPGRVAPS